ncbi:MAG: hypothetical protein ACK2UK_19825 [Candidatus Promineifilaceae bacterium]
MGQHPPDNPGWHPLNSFQRHLAIRNGRAAKRLYTRLGFRSEGSSSG